MIPRHVAVIGAGIVGVSTALQLNRRGLSVTLIDRSGPASGTSSGNAGLLAACAVVPVPVPGLWAKAPGMLLNPDQPLFVKPQHLPRAAPWLLRYMRHGTQEHVAYRARAIAQLTSTTTEDHLSLSRDTPAARYVIPCDYLYAYPNRAAFADDAFGWGIRRDLGFTWEELNAASVADFDPLLGPAVTFGVRLGGHGRITDPAAYVRALADVAMSQGTQMQVGDVTGLVTNGDRVTGVRIGDTVLDCDAVVVTTGAWSGPLARQLGLNVPLESERGYHLELWGPSRMPRTSTMVAAGKFVMTPMDGRLRLAGVVEYGGLSAAPSRAPLDLLRRQLARTLPGLTWTRDSEWMGHRPVIADSLPLIGAAPAVKGAWVGFGHDHLGLTCGPATGRILAQMITGARPNTDTAPFDPARFCGPLQAGSAPGSRSSSGRSSSQGSSSS